MLSPFLWPEAAVTLLRTFGVRRAGLRGLHEARRSVGNFRAQPKYHVPNTAASAFEFGVSGNALTAATSPEHATARAERVLAGDYEAYRWTWRPLPSDANAWLRHPVTGRAWGRDPWWRIRHLGRDSGDIKDLWEPARFGWAYDLMRGYLLTHDSRYAKCFHEHLQNWFESSPGFLGPHWSCGQETAIRAIALLYAESNFAGAAASTGEPMRRLQDVLAASGERIANAIGYAVSQRNNHGISEAVGLMALGRRFRDSHPEARAWSITGKRLLEKLVCDQFADDGWYIQHSFTYARLALDQCIVADRVLRASGERLSFLVRERLSAALDLLLAVIEPSNGLVPNHGANDGAFVHPITLTGYRDFRPLVTALCAILDRPIPANIPLDEEVLAWLDLRSPTTAQPIGDHVVTGSSGWAAVRVGGTAVFLRAGAYRSRPSHSDPLHLDIRFGGRETIVDAGTYSYNAAAPWNNSLSTAAVHNGPLVDNQEPGHRGPRFLWYRWPSSRLCGVSRTVGFAVLQAEIVGRVRRVIRVTAGRVEIDDIALVRDCRLTVRWLVHPDADAWTVAVAGDAKLRTANEHEPYAWFSPSYGVKHVAPSIEVTRRLHGGESLHSLILDRAEGTVATESCVSDRHIPARPPQAIFSSNRER